MNAQELVDRISKYLSDEARPWHFALLCVVVCLPNLVLHGNPGTDAANYYCPLIREFAAGRFDQAFWGMIPPLFPLLGGIVCALPGVSPLKAGQIVSILFFALGIFPLHALLRRTHSARIATVACVLYVFCSRLLRYASQGAPFSVKMFCMLSALLLLWELRGDVRRWYCAAALGLCCTGLALVRGEGVAASVLLLLWAVIGEGIYRWRHRSSWRRFVPAQTLVASAVFVAGILPWVAYEYQFTGYPVTDLRQIPYARMVLGGWVAHKPKRVRTKEDLDYLALLGKIREGTAFKRSLEMGTPVQERVRARRQRGGSRVKEVWKGLFPMFFLLALLCLVSQGWRRLGWGDLWLATVIVGHTVLLIVLLWRHELQKRYLAVTIPFLLGWAATGATISLRWLQRVWPERVDSEIRARVLIGAVSVFAVIMVWNGNQKGVSNLRDRFLDTRFRSSLQAGRWLRETGIDMVRKTPPRKSTWVSYHNERLPLILVDCPTTPYFGLCDKFLIPFRNFHVPAQELTEFCKANSVPFLVLSRPLDIVCDLPGSSRDAREQFLFCRRFGKKYPLLIYVYRPLLHRQPPQDKAAKS